MVSLFGSLFGHGRWDSVSLHVSSSVLLLERIKARNRPANAQNCTTNAVTIATSVGDHDFTSCSKHIVFGSPHWRVSAIMEPKVLEPQRLNAFYNIAVPIRSITTRWGCLFGASSGLGTGPWAGGGGGEKLCVHSKNTVKVQPPTPR